MKKTGKNKILVIAHGHPDFSPGGGELAAYSLYKGYARHPAVEHVVFIGRIKNDACSGGISRHRDNEYLWDQSLSDDFLMQGRNCQATLTTFADFLRSVRPEIVHLHHALHMGYEILEVIKATLPDAKIYFTLHEYVPICFHNGQMIKTDGRLCQSSDLAACHACFPQKSEADFWLRKRNFEHYFRYVDAFFAPSEFLRRRYIDWGLQPEKIIMLENGLRELEACPPRALKTGENRNRFGFFGQITYFKGLQQLFEGLNLLAPQDRAKIILEIHGDAFGEKAVVFTQKLKRKYKNLEKEGIARWLGAYDPSFITSRMSGVDWLVMPSIWWENSPVVIQEAFACKRPVIASNMGGMAEKIKHGVNGLLVAPRNPQAWADTLLECAAANGLWEKLHASIPAPLSATEAAEEHLRSMGVIYRCSD